ncbi:MAG: hypothetical protein WC485_01240 [Opitutaceae bacterium]
MPTAPSLTARLIAGLVVLGLVFARESFARPEAEAGGTGLQIRSVENTITKFVALDSHPTQPPTSPQLIKVWGSVLRPIPAGVLAASLVRNGIEPSQPGNGFSYRPTLVGIIELRI